ncbi:MAG: cytochrome d ubiquinol oxidase subunit II [Gammaproteobacteria bacterium]|nr:cytochrome d ubiquinol oxidase subunit II [Gammaproteobacteria bacterium]
MIFDYETLKLIWWLFMGVLLIGFALMDGFDLGVGTLLPFVGQTDEERRVVINTVAPHWEGNQVWFVTAGGALLAAWPLVYASAFSGLYGALLMVLFAFFLRPLGFDYRSKVSDPRWRNGWDWGLFIGGMVPALVFGIIFGNLFLGLPFHFDADMRSFYAGNMFDLLHPFALLAGVVSVSMLAMHGGVFLALRTEDAVRERSLKYVTLAARIFMASFAAAGVWLWFGIEGLRIVSMPDGNSAFMPLQKTVELVEAGWLGNYMNDTRLWAVPASVFVFALLACRLAARAAGVAFLFSALSVAGVVLTAGIALFPFIMPSSVDFNSSLTLWDSVSSHRTLNILFIVTVIFVPLIVIYTTWAFRIMRGKMTVARIRENEHTLY